LKTWDFCRWEKAQAECLCLPATVTVMLLDQEVDFFRQHLSFALHDAFASEAKVENMASLLSADAIGFDLAGRLKTDSWVCWHPLVANCEPELVYGFIPSFHGMQPRQKMTCLIC